MAAHFIAECLDCGHQAYYSPLSPACPRCGSEWRVARYDYDTIAQVLPHQLPHRPFNLWRYHELLPVQTPYPEISMGEGGTPLLRTINLGMMLGLPQLYIKDERQGPTSSFKDRQAAVTIALLKESGLTEMVVASTGNVAIAYSAYAARAGIKLWAFLTSLVPAEKMREVALYGTQVVKVTGSYDQTKQVAAEFARLRGLYLDTGARSIPTVESMKTIAYEIAEQLTMLLGRPNHGALWRTPDWYVQAVSGGLGPLGIMKGFEEMQRMGWVERPPKMALIQVEGCAPMVHAWKQDKAEAQPIQLPRTHITTLATGNPGRTYTLLYDYLKRYGGVFESVSDEEAFRAMHTLAKMEGISVEPATGVAFAGLIKLVRQGVIQPNELVVVNCTGHTMPIESHLLGPRWARHVVLPSTGEGAGLPEEEGLLGALSRLSDRSYSRVLIVDDHAPARILLRRVLQSLGEYEIFEADNGVSALRQAQSLHPDLIILDLMMPEMDGFTVLEQLKQNPETADIPVIVVTAKALTPQEKARLSGQIERLLQKGEFLNDEFIDEIRSLLR